MKICFICADPGVPVFGRKGCSTHVRETILALMDLGHEVRLVCSNDEGDDEGRDRIPTVKVSVNASRRLGFDLRHLLLDRRVGLAAEEVVRRWRPEAIYERYSLYSRSGTRLARRWGLPHILEVNAFMTEEQHERIRLAPLARYVERWVLSRARHVVVVSQPLLDRVASLRGSAETISRMPMAVNLERFNPAVSGESTRRAYGLDGRFVLGYVGTLTGWHGISLLYDLALRLSAQGVSDYAILVVGGDERRLAMHRARVAELGLQGVIHFIGEVPYVEVPRHIRAMDAGLVPDTTYWSSPAKLFEYHACGVPVLAPSVPAVEHAMTHGVEGFIFPPRDVEAMAAQAIELYRDPAGRAAMGRAARDRAERDHSWEGLANRVVDIFKRQEGLLRPRVAAA